MSVSIAQDSEYAGSDYWKWRAWIAGKPGELQKIEKVKWFLHPSFPQSVIVSRDRASGFRLEASGWGTFLLRAEVRYIDGRQETLRHHLEFVEPDVRPAPVKGPRAEPPVDRAPPQAPNMAPVAPAPIEAVPPMPGAEPKFESMPVAPPAPAARSAAKAKKIFLCYGSEDRQAALALRRALETLGVSVLDVSQIDANAPFDIAALDLIARADATIALVSSDVPTPWVAQEVTASLKSGKPTLVVTPEKIDRILGIDASVPVHQLDTNDPGAAAAVLRVLKLA